MATKEAIHIIPQRCVEPLIYSHDIRCYSWTIRTQTKEFTLVQVGHHFHHTITDHIIK